MDANGTRYHLLQGQRDWARTRVGAIAPAFAEKNLQWDTKRSEVTLFPEVLRFVASPSERTLTPDVRRVATWVVASADNGRLPFALLDKNDARVYVFEPSGKLAGDVIYEGPPAHRLHLPRADDQRRPP